MRTIKKIVIVSPIPASVSSSIQLILFYGTSSDNMIEYLSKEEIFLLIKYMLYKHIGEVLSIRFTLSFNESSIILNVKQIRSLTSVFRTEGFIEINTFNKVIFSEIIIQEQREEYIAINTIINEGYIVQLNEKEYEVRYYI
ncbi:MAG: hypothetical protein QXK54_04410 [Ignisphaera sp.]|uniref:Uncharacterized protein n=1 Tax=Ignisphaera aggregans TaxID=334771 RepID=A0A7C4D1F3_9CREN